MFNFYILAMRKKLLIYFHNLAVVMTYLAVIAGIIFILVSAAVFCFGTIIAGTVGIFAGVGLLWAARLLVELFDLLPRND